MKGVFLHQAVEFIKIIKHN